jgi:hypothetical protein
MLRPYFFAPLRLGGRYSELFYFKTSFNFATTAGGVLNRF